jgi:hypothetical protein
MRAIEKLGQQPLALLDRLPPQILAFELVDRQVSL